MVCVSKGIPSLQSETKHYLCFPASKLLTEKETPLLQKQSMEFKHLMVQHSHTGSLERG
jgi:hypothetical protein